MIFRLSFSNYGLLEFRLGFRLGFKLGFRSKITSTFISGFWVRIWGLDSRFRSGMYLYELTRDRLRSFVRVFVCSIITAMCYCRNLHAIASKSYFVCEPSIRALHESIHWFLYIFLH